MITKLKPYSEYKKVAYDYANELPKDWELLPNVAIFQERIERGQDDSEELLSITVKSGIVKQEDVDIKKNTTPDDKSRYKRIEVGDIAYNPMNMWFGACGCSDYCGITSPVYTVLKSKIQINPRFFHYMFRTNFYSSYAKRLSYGIMDERLSLRYLHFKHMYSVYPPLATQNAIVEYLDKKNEEIDKFIRNKERLVELLEEEKSEIINKTITQGLDPSVAMKPSGSNWLGEIPKNWAVKRLRYLGRFQNGVSEGADYFGSGYPFVSYGDVYNNMVLPSSVPGLAKSTNSDRKNLSVREGDIFFTRTSETVEEIGFTSTCEETIPNAVFSGFLIRFRPLDKVLYTGFSKYYFRSNLHRRFFVKEMNMVTRASLSQELLKKMPVLLPPLEEQKRIAGFLESEMSKIDILVLRINREISAIKEYRESFVTDLVLGKRSVNNITAKGKL